MYPSSANNAGVSVTFIAGKGPVPCTGESAVAWGPGAGNGAIAVSPSPLPDGRAPDCSPSAINVFGFVGIDRCPLEILEPRASSKRKALGSRREADGQLARLPGLAFMPSFVLVSRASTTTPVYRRAGGEPGE
eukprot:GHVT01078780.1.p3 GENE.GHVT01078780.1~~GHVT01078780.1.p3  ORF type:complete len:133 (+),score=20.65 GHVT01078780.1:2620-3018(+)